MMPDINFITAGLDDLGELQELSVLTFHQAFAGLNTESNMKYYMDQAFSPDQLLQELGDRNSLFLLLQTSGTSIGYLKLNFAPAQTDLNDPLSLEIQRIYVHPDYQNLKLGEKMILKAVEIAEDHQLRYLWLGVWEKNLRAIRFYERHGFAVSGQHPFPFGDEMQTDLIMKRYL
jgi:diamine N-acetyltransferase